jgi:hypothetical protein
MAPATFLLSLVVHVPGDALYLFDLCRETPTGFECLNPAHRTDGHERVAEPGGIRIEVQTPGRLHVFDDCRLDAPGNAECGGFLFRDGFD